MVRALVVAALFLGGCAEDLEATGVVDDAQHENHLEVPSWALHFHADRSIEQLGVLVAGGAVAIHYAPERLPDCRADVDGWSITGFARLPDATVRSFAVAGAGADGSPPTPALLQLPLAGTVSLWFQVTNREGCSAWDSDFGKNYQFEVKERPTIDFKANGSVRSGGELGTWPEVVVLYDLSRLPLCRLVTQGTPTWDVAAFYRFDGGPVSMQSMTEQRGSTRVPAPWFLEIPRGAKELEVWFFNSDRSGCSRYDSVWGQNYHFRISNR